ncbi:ABC transporter ATP-binding protein [Plasticicumulans sp.]|uniref:ABC transporter ATP-binding protein n=1 Tax=Plasticicumulans sp. TaxID=2307179 RepID=UPI002C0CBB29|nr:ABC transporter ATP-binding protein [Plasticicumulans sp.]MBS0601857.1 ABC transporter ATP-binding protein [Pseudomonadota bacterium]HMV37690.1 ABC transporter ATP-binding protein [Plasticicumulans sp.]HMW28887.1 ABC transporter ATP-binding protein [Plasticicumulans sp.]HMW41034.1 ABC transporter ATP-binding protein [Plasticicumulans sp.]HMZ09421.1 ABC transporter ATP-binding protein [Plasticicumulans sp.]
MSTQSGGDAFVRFREVRKTYDGEHLVVKNLNLDIGRGEFLTLLGPSGSGKTTALMMLAGFETPTHGEILLDGKPLHNLPPYRRDIGMVFQNYALFPHMTVAENLAFPLSVRKLPKADIAQKVARALDMVRLGALAGRYPAQMSGGQQQRVALARALVFEPKLVLMDEPLGALDKQLREHMQLEIKQLHAQLGLTVVYVTHDQSEALTMSDRVAVFNDGVIQQIDAPETLYEHPQNSFVAHFIGENNRLAGEVQTIDDRSCTVRLDDGPLVQARAVNVGGVGSRTSASIRPERLRLAGAAQGADNVFEARIRDFIYLGDHLRVRLEFAGSREFTVKVPVSQFDPRWRAGDTLAVGWSADDLRALDPVAA